MIVDKHQRDTPQKLSHFSHHELVAMLGEAHHVRNDETMASRLLALAHKLNNERWERGQHRGSEYRPP